MVANGVHKVNLTSIVYWKHQDPIRNGTRPADGMGRPEYHPQAAVSDRVSGRWPDFSPAQETKGIFQSLVQDGPLKSFANASSKSTKAELKFYKPFQPNIKKVGKILKDNKKPKVKMVSGIPQLTFDKDYLYLKTCENA